MCRALGLRVQGFDVDAAFAEKTGDGVDDAGMVHCLDRCLAGDYLAGIALAGLAEEIGEAGGFGELFDAGFKHLEADAAAGDRHQHREFSTEHRHAAVFDVELHFVDDLGELVDDSGSVFADSCDDGFCHYLKIPVK